ncbi:hypothetical protein THAOC_24544 [Thalassiosira oceanica]|uniref:Uncharacterized protein n=1 Tax=Thalassiosira oceanica TaxID=159749 RepID=K0SAH2_THAOC|nr:hypothetical protein THAOC_24544 [Thalassiosira oceanica]|eukprot:EJK55692.1 hypothetical protein THAOC_24544 [Thalassiosira oceanica]
MERMVHAKAADNLQAHFLGGSFEHSQPSDASRFYHGPLPEPDLEVHYFDPSGAARGSIPCGTGGKHQEHYKCDVRPFTRRCLASHCDQHDHTDIRMGRWVEQRGLDYSIQAVVMVFSFVALPCVLATKFTSWADLNSSTYPRPQFYETPSRKEQLEMWQLSIIVLSYFTLPHYIQRVYAASDLRSLKVGVSIWFTILPAIYIGTVGVKILDGADTSSPFTSIIVKLMDLGGFSQAIGYIALTASLAAIMSTADSLVIGISQLVTSEIIYPFMPDESPHAIAWSGRLASLATMIVASLIGLAWREGITALSRIQFPLSAQAAPAFLLGLYTPNEHYDCHPWSIAAAAVLSTIYVFCIIFAYLGRESNPAAIDAGLTGMVLNFSLVILLEIARRLMKLSPMAVNAKKMDKNGEGSGESSKSAQLFPLRPNGTCPDYYDSEIIRLHQDLSGMPPILMPTSFPIDEENIEAIDPDLVELTVHERSMRTSYDSTNTLIRSRRSVISKTLDDIQSSTKLRLVDTQESMQSRRRLSALLIKPDEKLDDHEGEFVVEEPDGRKEIPELDAD